MKTVQVTKNFMEWFADLRDQQAKRRIQARIDRAELGNYGDYKTVGEGVLEMRIHYGNGYRVYFVEQGSEIIVLLAGGTKSTQEKDIKNAIKLSNRLGA